MSSAQVGAVLQFIRKLGTTMKDQELPDRELLERFARHCDEAAFAVLLKRHGPMVLNVCRSVLQNVHDAEDAFQAAFLLLSQKAGSIHRRETVGGWLYRVAYHVAVRAKANAARRRIIEKRAVAMPCADPVLDMSLRELRAMLFEELERLPEQYRAPVVLCALEENSLEDAARLLGWTKGAIKGRLQRGRDMLRVRLRRRGLELPATLLATAFALHSVSGQVSATLADSSLRAAVRVAARHGVVAGAVSADVAALVQGARMAMFIAKAKIACVLLLAGSIATSTAGVVWQQVSAVGQADTQSTQAQKQSNREQGAATINQATQDTPESVHVHGQVLDPEGRPLAGAKLYLGPTKPEQPTFLVRAITGKDGSFAFTFARSDLDMTYSDKPKGHVLAMAKDFGSDWAVVDPAQKDVELTLRLSTDVPINGRILDQDARPVAGVKVHVNGVVAYPGRELKDVLEDFRQGRLEKLNQSSKLWIGPLPGQVLTTGADGRIRLTGFGSDCLVYFHIEGPGIVAHWMKAMTRPGEPVNIGRNDRLYGAAFDYVAQASRPVRGVVRDKTTRKPVAGVEIGSPYLAKKVHTDTEGRYELLGLPKSDRYDLRVRPANGQPYFAGSLRLSDIPGLDPLVANIELVSGIPLRGRVTDKATGQPVPQAKVDYHPLFPNPAIEKLAPFDGPLSEATTGVDGTFALVVLPGPGILGATGPKRESYMSALVTANDVQAVFKNNVTGPQGGEETINVAAPGAAKGFIVQQDYHALVLLDAEEGAKALTRDAVLEPARTLTGSVVAPDGKPIVGITVYGLTWKGSETLKSDNFTVRGLNPRRPRHVLFIDKEKRLGSYMVLRGDELGPLTIKLQPCGSVTGRIIDKDGQPVPGMDLTIQHAGLSGLGQFFHITTGSDGRFRAEGLVAGVRFRVRKTIFPRVLSEVIVESGKNKDLGDIQGHVEERP